MPIAFVPIGYLPKATATADRMEDRPWPGYPGVIEICSISGCISPLPDDYRDSWTHNTFELFNDEAAARATIPPGAEGELFEFYAYKLLPIAFDGQGETVIDMDDFPSFGGVAVACNALPPDYERLGFDCVQTEWARSISGFGCSPLSCNGMAEEIPVNRHCLIDGLDDAIETARRFAKEQPEPGVYYVVEVWRKRRGGSAAGSPPPLTDRPRRV